MEPFLENNNEEDREYLARREQRRARMLKEKRRRQKRMQMMKLALLIFVLGGIGFATVRFLGGSAMAGHKPEHTEEKQEAKKDETDSGKNEASEQAGNLDIDAVNKEELSQQTENMAKEPPKEQAHRISFQENEDTVGIYSEEVNSAYGILVNADTNTIAASKGGRDRIVPASMTKVLTALVAAEHVTKEQLEDTFTMTLEITDYTYSNGCSDVGFLDGEEVKVKDLFYGTILKSGGDAAVGLATYVAGSHEKFVEMMNEKLEELGLADTAHFTNCIGLYDENHYCTPYDLAVIMKAAMENEWCREVLGMKCYTTIPTEQHPEGIVISNWFLRRIEDKETGGEVLGAKTGYVVESGNCAVSCSTQDDGTSYICVTAGAYSNWRCIYDHVEIYNNYTTHQ